MSDSVDHPPYRLYRSTMKSMRFIFGILEQGGIEDKSVNGQEAVFIEGMYITDNETKIALLDKELKNNHPHIHNDSENTWVEASFADPIEQIKARARADVLRELLRAGVPLKDFGNYGQEIARLKGISATSNMSAESVASNSGQGEIQSVQQRLATLKVPTSR